MERELEVSAGAIQAQYGRGGWRMQRVPTVVSWYFHPLLFFTIIASDMRVPFVTSRRGSLCARTVGRARFSSRFAFPERPQSAYVQPALIKNEQHFFSYYVNGPRRGKRYCFISGCYFAARPYELLFVP